MTKISLEPLKMSKYPQNPKMTKITLKTSKKTKITLKLIK